MAPRAAGDNANEAPRAEDGRIEELLLARRFSDARALARRPDAHVSGVDLGRICDGLWPDATDDQADAFLLEVFESAPTEAPIAVLQRRRFLRGDMAGVEKALVLGLAKLPRSVTLLRDLAKLLVLRKRLPEAQTRVGELLSIDPSDLEARAIRAFIDASLGWLDRGIAELRAIEPSAPGLVRPTLTLLSLYSSELSPEDVLAIHLRRGAEIERGVARLDIPRPTERPKRLKVGYVSADLRRHSVASFIEPILRAHDRARFEVHAYHTRPGGDDVTKRIAALNLGFHDVSSLGDAELAERIRRDQIDVLVDLGGHTEHSRLGVFARHPAPVLVSYLGYPATTGLRRMNARLTDSIADPPGIADDLCTERLVRLEGSAWCFSPPTESPPVATRVDAPLTFGSFNAMLKVVPDVVRTWAEILRRVPGSRLFLKASALAVPAAATRMRELFETEGISADRLTLKSWEADAASHLAAYGEVDVALDTFPYNGTTTTCEAFWMGVPVVTLAGDRHAARVGASLCAAVGTPEHVARTKDEYVSIAVALGSDIEQRRRLRSELRRRLQRGPLCDASGFTRQLESAYDQLFEEARSAVGVPEPTQDEANRLANEARRASDAGRAELAAHFARKVLTFLPAHVDLAMIVAHAHEALGDPNAALRVLTRAAAPLFDERPLGEPKVAGETPPASDGSRPTLRVPSHLTSADLLRELARLRGALGDSVGRGEALLRTVALHPGSADAHTELASHLRATGSAERAAVELREALRLEPGHARATMLLGILEMAWGASDEGLALLERAAREDPTDRVAFSNLLYAHQYAFEPHEDGFRRHLLYGIRYVRSRASAPSSRDARRGQKLRIGYLSADLREHSVARFVEAILEHHDREAFDITLYASVAQPDVVTERLVRRVDRAVFVHDASDEEVAAHIERDGIDILIELGGHTAKSRLAVLAERPAPVQVSYLGYPDTSGLSAIDYRLTDSVADPAPTADAFHVETLLRLPDAAWCFAPRPESPPVHDRRNTSHVVFGSFNDVAKIGDPVLETWAELCERVPEARLLLKSKFAADNPVRERLRRIFEARGVDPARVELRYGSSDVVTHLAAYGDMDIGLDPFPYCGTTTTCEALDMGVPVVSLAGDRHVARVGASLLARVGLTDLVAETRADYVRIGVALANDPARRAALRRSLRDTLRSSVLCDAARFTRGFEEALRTMWRAHERGDAKSLLRQVDDRERSRSATFVAEAGRALASGRLDDAEVAARLAIATDPRSAEARNILGNALVARRDDEGAEAAYRAAIELDEQFYKAYNNVGNLLSKRGDKAGAVRMFERAIVLEPDAFRAHANLAGALRDLGRNEEAIESFTRSLGLQSNPGAAIGLAQLLADSGEIARAETVLSDALRAAPGDAKLQAASIALRAKRARAGEAGRLAKLDLARRELAAGRGLEAAAAIREGLLDEVPPPGAALRAEALDILWRAQLAAGETDAAFASYARALVEGDPERSLARIDLLASAGPARMLDLLRSLRNDHRDRPKIAFVLASYLLDRGALSDAEKVIAEARAEHPSDLDLMSLGAAVALFLGRQSEAVALQREVAAKLPGGVSSDLLLSMHYTSDATPVELHGAHVRWGTAHANNRLPPMARRPRGGRKLRLGYLSGDFYRHSVGRLMTPTLERHDRSRFEVFAYMTSPKRDELTEHVERTVGAFRDVSSLDDESLARLIRKDEIDVLVDLSGHTAWSRLGALTRKPAFVAVSYLGYPDTTGLDAIDYRITDAIADPQGADAYSVEALVRLPRTAWCFSPGDLPRPDPRAAGAPVVFGSFNSLAKVTPEVVRAWAEIALRVPRSRILLKASGLDDPGACSTWLERFASVGLDPSRVDLLGHVAGGADHLALYGRMDVALDPFPYNGTMTTCEALAMGVPVVSLSGDRHAARVGASLLSSVGLSSLVATDLDAYEDIAVRLGTEAALRKEVTEGLGDRVRRSPLGDAQGFTAALETAFEAMWERGPRPSR